MTAIPGARFSDGDIAVKVCGLTRLDDALHAAEAGAAALGFNFWPGSKRFLNPESASWLADLAGKVTRVGVFVNARREEIQRAFREGWIDVVQLHGDESLEEITYWKEQEVPVVRAVWLRSGDDVALLKNHPADALLLDTWKASGYGGHGETFPWQLARAAREAFPETRMLLAGGLTPENVREAIVESGIHAVDVAGGVESAPGVKDPNRVAAFLAAARDGTDFSLREF